MANPLINSGDAVLVVYSGACFCFELLIYQLVKKQDAILYHG